MKKILIICWGCLLSVFCMQGQETVEDFLIEGIEYHDAGEYAKAIASYEKALKIDPDAVEVIYEISLSLLEAGDYYEAIAYCERLISRDDKFSILAYNTKGSALNYLGKREEAIDIFLEGIRKEEDFYLSYYNLGLAFYGNEEFEEAMKAFITCIDLNPKHTGAHLNLGRTMFVLNKKEESLLSLYYFLLLEPDSEKSLWAYDTLLLLLGNLSEEEPEKTHKNTVELFTDQTSRFILSFGKENGNPVPAESFWREFYVPFFTSMVSWGYTDIFCHYIRQSVHKIPEAWIAVNKNRIKGFNAWLRRQ